MIIEKLRPEHVLQTTALQQQIVPYHIDPDFAVKHYETMVHQPDCIVLVAREGDEILGTVSGFVCRGLAGSFLTIEDLIVQEHLRGKGIGRQLMSAMDDFGRSRDCCYALLVSSGFRKRAHHFYETIGYTEDVRGFRKDL